jgi:hypothetical protein
MARTNRKRAARTSGGNSASGDVCKLSATAAAQYGHYCGMLAASGNYTIPQILDQQSMWLRSHMATAATATAAPNAMKQPAAPTNAGAAPAQRQAQGRPRKGATAAAKSGGDLNQAILALIPDTGPIQQSKLAERMQTKYPNRWRSNIIGTGLARLQKAGTLVRQGGTGNKAVWALAHSRATQQQQAA